MTIPSHFLLAKKKNNDRMKGTDMKAFSSILAMLAAPAMLSVAVCAESPGALDGYLPSNGTLKQGAAVRPVFTKEFAELQRSFVTKLAAQSEEKRKAFLEGLDPNAVPDYDADIWPDKAEYDKFVAEWKKSIIQPVTEVAVGLQSAGKGEWKILSATVDARTRRTVPLTISALKYDATKNVWISNNGELAAKNYSATDANIYGAQTGTEWNLAKEDSLSRTRETVRVSKTTDGKFVYVSYSFTEQSVITGASIAQGSYVLRFPIVTAAANMGTPGRR